MKKKRKAKKLGHYVLAGVLGYDMSYLFKLDNKKRSADILSGWTFCQEDILSGPP